MTKDFCVHCMAPLVDGVCKLCGKTNDEYHPAIHYLQPGTVLADKYQIGSVLGSGGFGITYIGRDINLDIKVAVKEYYPNGYVSRNNTISKDITINYGEGEEIFEKGKSSFLREARILAKFDGVPNIVSVKDFFSENNTAYIVMEYVEGISLGNYMTQYGLMTFEKCLDMMRPVMFALSKIHEKGLVHRDVSPSNILVMNDGSVKLLDFGATREFNSDEKTLSILLNPKYAPQEQYSAKGHQGPWTDVYAVAATMYRMLTGIAPENAMDRMLEDDLKSICQMNPGVSLAQEEVIRKAMALHQKERYQTIEEFYEACEKSLHADAGESVMPSVPRQKMEKRSKPSFLISSYLMEIVSFLILFWVTRNCLMGIGGLSIESIMIPLLYEGAVGVVFAGIAFMLGKRYIQSVSIPKKRNQTILFVCSVFGTLCWSVYSCILYYRTNPYVDEKFLPMLIVFAVLSVLLSVSVRFMLGAKMRKSEGEFMTKQRAKKELPGYAVIWMGILLVLAYLLLVVVVDIRIYIAIDSTEVIKAVVMLLLSVGMGTVVSWLWKKYDTNTLEAKRKLAVFGAAEGLIFLGLSVFVIWKWQEPIIRTIGKYEYQWSLWTLWDMWGRLKVYAFPMYGCILLAVLGVIHFSLLFWNSKRG